MAKRKSANLRRAREIADRAMFARMQRAIDASHGLVWEHFFGAYASISGNRTAKRFCEKFDEAWHRSMLPNTERDDMTTNGNYIATGRDINGYVQPN